jgi:hypothetical protein
MTTTFAVDVTPPQLSPAPAQNRGSVAPAGPAGAQSAEGDRQAELQVR